MHRRHFIKSLGAFAVSGTALQSSFAAGAPAATSIAEQLAAYTAALRYEDLDEQTIEAVRTHLADALGCGVAALGEGPVTIARKVAL
ncbi:MmgE/PrpD family protein, partial [Caballeronia sp. M23-90]